jgi:hypothetical protein
MRFCLGPAPRAVHARLPRLLVEPRAGRVLRSRRRGRVRGGHRRGLLRARGGWRDDPADGGAARRLAHLAGGRLHRLRHERAPPGRGDRSNRRRGGRPPTPRCSPISPATLGLRSRAFSCRCRTRTRSARSPPGGRRSPSTSRCSISRPRRCSMRSICPRCSEERRRGTRVTPTLTAPTAAKTASAGAEDG